MLPVPVMTNTNNIKLNTSNQVSWNTENVGFSLAGSVLSKKVANKYNANYFCVQSGVSNTINYKYQNCKSDNSLNILLLRRQHHMYLHRSTERSMSFSVDSGSTSSVPTSRLQATGCCSSSPGTQRHLTNYSAS